jgi:hypothetical protein
MLGKRLSKKSGRLVSLKKLNNGLAIGLVVFLSVFGSLVSLSSANTYACEPDPAEPLKCFCESVDGQLSTEADAVRDICETNETDQADPNEGLLGENGIVKRVINLLTWLTGGLAVIYVIAGGFKFMTSGGNSDSVASARKMILYALVGIAVVILSNVIISFVIGLVNNANR